MAVNRHFSFSLWQRLDIFGIPIQFGIRSITASVIIWEYDRQWVEIFVHLTTVLRYLRYHVRQ
jgi:hypothetical protein